MRSKEWKEVRRKLTKVLSDPRLESGQRERLRRFQRELDKIQRSGRPDEDRLRRVIEGIADVLLEVLEQGDAIRWPR